jgi:hypothetical protein
MFRAIFCPSSGAQGSDLQHVVQCPNVVVGWRFGERQRGTTPTTTLGHYTTCCKSQSCAPEDGQKIARNMFS